MWFVRSRVRGRERASNKNKTRTNNVDGFRYSYWIFVTLSPEVLYPSAAAAAAKTKYMVVAAPIIHA